MVNSYFGTVVFKETVKHPDRDIKRRIRREINMETKIWGSWAYRGNMEY